MDLHLKEKQFSIGYVNRKGEEKKALYPAILLLKLKGFLHYLEDINNTSSKFVVKVFQQWHLTALTFMNSRYISIQKVLHNNFVVKDSGVLLPAPLFDLFALKIETFASKLGIFEEEDCQHSPLPHQGRLMRKQLLGDCHMFAVNIVGPEGKIICSSLERFFCEEQALQWGEGFLKQIKERGDSASGIELSKYSTTAPSDLDLMKLVFLKRVIKNVEAKAVDNCDGCFVDSPSQKDHLDGGCIAPLVKKVEMFFNHIIRAIDPKTLSQEFDKLRGKMGLLPILSLHFAKAAVAYIGREQIVALIESKFPEEKKIKEVDSLLNFLDE